MNKNKIEYLIRRAANNAGVDIHRHRPEESLPGRIATMLNHHKVSVVLDVGANIGQFATAIRESGYRSRIVSFEPLHSAHDELQAACGKDPNWYVAPRMAIGAEKGELDIIVAGNSFSSSALPMLNEHLKASPSSARIGVERAMQIPLDMAAAEYIEDQDIVFIKIDTQGFERFVLDGAVELLQHAIGIHVELSFVPLYEGQPLFDEIVDRIRAEGFELWGIWSGIHEPKSGRMLQVDATFFRMAMPKAASG